MAPITVATDCSGMETPMMALRALGVAVRHLFACDIDKAAKATIMANFPPEVWFDNLCTRDLKGTPKAELYVAGFPCQPFSMAGKMKGFEDTSGRGTVFFKILDYLRHAQPKAFVLENVSGLQKIQGGKYFDAIMQCLEDLGTYTVHHEILNTADHGVPQHRRRVYIVGIRRDVDKGTFAYPEPIARIGMEEFLDPKPRGNISGNLPQSGLTARANVKLHLDKLLRAKKQPFAKPYIADVDSSPDRTKCWLDLSPCFTCARYKGHWCTSRGRRLNVLTEMMRLHGMPTPADGFQVVVSKPALGKMLGNAMSCNVLERLLAKLLPAAGLVRGPLPDRWLEASKIGKLPAWPKAARLPAAAPKRATAEAGLVATAGRIAGGWGRRTAGAAGAAGKGGLSKSLRPKVPAKRRLT